MAIAQSMSNNTQEEAEIEEVQTAEVKRTAGETWSAIVSITKAIRKTGLEEGGSFRFDPGAADDLGMVPAIGQEETVDGRGALLTRNIRNEGQDGRTKRLVLPQEVLDVLGIDDEEIGGENPAELTVYAGDRLLAFERIEGRTVTIDMAEPDEEETADQFKDVLQSVDGIGEGTRDAIRSTFDSLEALVDDLEKGGEQLRSIESIGETRVEAVEEALKNADDVEFDPQ